MKYCSYLKIVLIGAFVSIIKGSIMRTTEVSISVENNFSKEIMTKPNNAGIDINPYNSDTQIIDKIVQDFIDCKNKKEELRILTSGGQVIDLRQHNNNKNNRKTENIPAQQNSGHNNVRYVMTILQSKGFMFIGITDLSKLLKTIRDRLTTTTTTAATTEMTEDPESENTDAADTGRDNKGTNGLGNTKPGGNKPGGSNSGGTGTRETVPENADSSTVPGADSSDVTEPITGEPEVTTSPEAAGTVGAKSPEVGISAIIDPKSKGSALKEKQKLYKKGKLKLSAPTTYKPPEKIKKDKLSVSSTTIPSVFKEKAWWQNFLAQDNGKK